MRFAGANNSILVRKAAAVGNSDAGRQRFGEWPVETEGDIWYICPVSPTIFRYRNYRFFFFAREERECTWM
jgi:hypothetical protein